MIAQFQSCFSATCEKQFLNCQLQSWVSYISCLFLGDFIRDLVALDSGGSGGVVWRLRANTTKLVCAVGSRNGTEETKLLVLDFDINDK